MSIVVDFCKEFGLPDEALEHLSDEYKKLKANFSAFKSFNRFVLMYEENYEIDCTPIFNGMEDISKTSGIHKFTLDFLYMVSLLPHLKKLYEQNNIDYDILYDSVCDLKWKLYECKAVYDVWGIFVGWWTIDFFKLKRFAIGRLQFNIMEFSRDMSVNDLSFCKGERYIEVHIPSSGHLNYEECQSAYKRAAEFFSKHYGIENIVFGCHSWLLCPDNKKILPESSNILKFMSDYTILETLEDSENSNLWRIFDVIKMPETPLLLPENTSLRRAFKRWLEAGNTINQAFGVIVFSNIK